MFERAYRQRLEADLQKWVADGVIAADNAVAIRRARFSQDETAGLPGTFAMLGMLMLAASVSAFVAANWQDIPRVVKLGGILAIIAGAFMVTWRLDVRGWHRAANAMATFATLCFGAGVALVGQMYHLPADWPAGAMLVAIGALVAATLTGKDGPLIVAFTAMTAWTWGRNDIFQANQIHWSFLILFLPAFLLVLGRESRFLAQVAVLSLSAWLFTLFASSLSEKHFFSIVAAGLAISVLYIVVGLITSRRDWPRALGAFLTIGIWCFAALLCVEIARVLETYLSTRQAVLPLVYPIYAAGVVAVAGLAMLGRHEGRGWLVLALALGIGLCVPLLFFAGAGTAMAGRIIVAVAVLASAVAMIAGGLLTGIRAFVAAGYVVFGLSLLTLLWRTVGTLLDQSLFFLVAGLALLALGAGARKLTRWTKPSPRRTAGGGHDHDL